jgi:hypothetical protein
MELDTAAKLRAFAAKAGLAPEGLLQLAARKGVPTHGEAHGEKRKGGNEPALAAAPAAKRSLTGLEEQIAREACGRGLSDDSMQTLLQPASRLSLLEGPGAAPAGLSSPAPFPGSSPGPAARGKVMAKRWATRGAATVVE